MSTSGVAAGATLLIALVVRLRFNGRSEDDCRSGDASSGMDTEGLGVSFVTRTVSSRLDNLWTRA